MKYGRLYNKLILGFFCERMTFLLSVTIDINNSYLYIILGKQEAVFQ